MVLRRARVEAPLGLGAAEFEKEAQTVKQGCVRFFERTIGGVKVLVMIVNRKDGFMILKIKDDGVVEPIFDGREHEGNGK
jgi:hypothetical protein